jgi:ADP-glucose pyrophosphorylase
MGRSLLALLQSQASPFAKHSRLERRWLVADSAKVSDSAELSGFLVAGDDAVIEAGAQVQDCVLLPGAVVRAGETLRRRVISASSQGA